MIIVAHMSRLHVHTPCGVVQLAPLAIAVAAYAIGLLLGRREEGR